MIVRVFDTEGDVRVNKAIGGHIGRIDSKITYELRADVESAGRSEWITGIDDLMGDAGDEGTDLFERNRGSCGHVANRGIGRSVARVDNLF
jgi:hypothetical protein